MTKRHFEWAAARIRKLEPCVHPWRLKYDDQCNRCAELEAFVDLFTEFGPNFDEARFRQACQPVTACEIISRTGEHCVRSFGHEGRCRR